MLKMYTSETAVTESRVKCLLADFSHSKGLQLPKYIYCETHAASVKFVLVLASEIHKWNEEINNIFIDY